MHDHISSHNLPHPLNAPLLSWLPNNDPARLKNIKCSLHILSVSLLFFREPIVFLLLGITMCLYKNRPLRVDTISSVIALGVCMAHNLIAHQWGIPSASLANTGDRWSMLIFLRGPAMSKKESQIHRS
jgi:hypothetical protein